MSAALGEQFWLHAASATAFRVLAAAAGLDTYLESRIEVTVALRTLLTGDLASMEAFEGHAAALGRCQHLWGWSAEICGCVPFD